MIVWRHKPGRHLGCPFEYDNPEPEPVRPDHGDLETCPCYDDTDWVPTIQCHRHPAVRVELADGRWMNCCSPEAHGVAPVVWWAPLVGPRFQSTFERVLKYLYREEDIIALAERPHPFFSLAPKNFEVRWR